MEEAEVAGDDRRRSAARLGRADARGDEAIDAVGAAVAEEEGVGFARRQEGLLVADRHARGGIDEVAVGMGLSQGEMKPRLGWLIEAFELVRDGFPRRRVGLEPAVR